MLKDVARPYVRAVRRLTRLSVLELAWAQEKTYSQFGEDLFLRRYFEGKPPGFYVDVGAFHPIHYSNTFALYEQGWHGINIEPSPDGYAALSRHRPRDINLQLAVATTEGPVPFKLAGSFAGIDNEQHLWREMPAATMTVTAQMLVHVLDEHATGAAIDLLDVDCEGQDLDILQSNDWDRYRPRLVLVEAHEPEAEASITSFLVSVGYTSHARLDLTMVFETKS